MSSSKGREKKIEVEVNLDTDGEGKPFNWKKILVNKPMKTPSPNTGEKKKEEEQVIKFTQSQKDVLQELEKLNKTFDEIVKPAIERRLENIRSKVDSFYDSI